MNRLLHILILLLLGCGQPSQERSGIKTNKQELDSTNKNDTILFHDHHSEQNNNKFEEHPFTSNPVKLHLKENKVNFDSLESYFKYKDIKNLEKICIATEQFEYNDLPTVIFSHNAIKTRNSEDTLFLSHFQFLVGNLKTPKEFPKILVFVNYTEGWGHEIFAVSVDSNYNIIGSEVFCSSQGDGGDFYKTEIGKISDLTYEFVTKQGYQTFTEPIDTLKYHRIKGRIEIELDGSFNQVRTKVDSNLVELIK